MYNLPPLTLEPRLSCALRHRPLHSTRIRTMPATGKITQVIGSTFDAEFPEEALPAIYNALKIDHQTNGTRISLTGEVASHLGGGKVRAVALGSTDGLARGMDVMDTGAPVAVP